MIKEFLQTIRHTNNCNSSSNSSNSSSLITVVPLLEILIEWTLKICKPAVSIHSLRFNQYSTITTTAAMFMILISNRNNYSLMSMKDSNNILHFILSIFNNFVRVHYQDRIVRHCHKCNRYPPSLHNNHHLQLTLKKN